MTELDRESYVNMLEYFWFEKGDLTRFSGWNDDLVAREFPAVWHAWNSYKGSEKVLDAVIKSLRP